jgi:hypothetical protein
MVMRRILQLTLMLMAAMVAWAAPVSENQAKHIAAQFAAQQIAAARGSQTVVPQLAMKQAEGAFYVYNVGSRDGFVVVSGDDRTPAQGNLYRWRQETEELTVFS